MAKLITELVDYKELQILTEESNGKKHYKIVGPYMQAELKNKNGRTYARNIIEREVDKLNKMKIAENRAYGELDHPPSPVVNLKSVSHMIKELHMDGNNAIGESEILDTPNGRIATTILDANGQLMVSSRGLGNVKKDGMVESNFDLITVDIVSDGSAPDSYVEGILENKEYIIGEDGTIVEKAVEKLQETVDKKYDQDIAVMAFKQFIQDIRNNLNKG